MGFILVGLFGSFQPFPKNWLYHQKPNAHKLNMNPPQDGDELSWESPRFEERQQERNRMVANQVKGRGVSDPDVVKAMRNVPRHLFVPQEQRSSAYQDSPLPIGKGQTISQPYIVAYMTELLELEQGDKVLEIGTGSGYQAAVLSELTSNVYSIEIIETLGNKVKRRFDKLGYDPIKTKIADGYYGWDEHAPFDAIIVTAAAGHVPPPLTKQLKTGGKMIIPVGGTYQTQKLMKVMKSGNGKVRTKSLMAVRFVPMTGAAQDK
jgi:protein-L-isoaspartate(D-aspartate) O-methyltransferase